MSKKVNRVMRLNTLLGTIPREQIYCAQFGESGQRFGSIRPVAPGVFGVSRVQCNQVVGLVRIPPLLDAPLRAMRWQFSRSLSQMASAAPASPMTLPHFSMGT